MSKLKCKCVYLIDYENVHISGLNGLFLLSAQDEVVVFLNKRLSLQLPVMSDSAVLLAKLSVEVCCVGCKNSLDFQLSSYLGFLLGSRKDITEYVIVSKDHAFQLALDYWSKKFSTIKFRQSNDLAHRGTGEMCVNGTNLLDKQVVLSSKSVSNSSLVTLKDKQSKVLKSGIKSNTLNNLTLNKTSNVFTQSELKQQINQRLLRSKLIGLNIDRVLKCLVNNKSLMNFHNALVQSDIINPLSVYKCLKTLHIEFWEKKEMQAVDLQIS